MTQESINFLESNRFHYDILVKAGYVKEVDYYFKETLLSVIRKEFQPGYNAVLWCGPCVADMIKFAWTQYDKWKKNNIIAGGVADTK